MITHYFCFADNFCAILAAMAHYVTFRQQVTELRVRAFLAHTSSRNLNFLHISICLVNRNPHP